MVRCVPQLQPEWHLSSRKSLPPRYWVEVETLEGRSLLPEENRDENKTSGFLIELTFMFQLKKIAESEIITYLTGIPEVTDVMLIK